MRLLYFTRHYTVHDARWLRVLAAAGLELGFLPLARIDAGKFRQQHPTVDLLVSPEIAPGATTAQLEAVQEQVADTWQSFGPDVVLAGPLTDAGYLAVRIDPVRTLLMSWAFDVFFEPLADTAVAARLQVVLAAGAPLFADCGAVVDRCSEIAGRPAPVGCVLPWGLAAEDRPAPLRGHRARLGDEAATVVLAVRGFEPVHRPLLLVEAFRRAHAANSSLRLWLAGGGSLRAETEAAVTAAGLASVVRFLGVLDQAALAGGYAEADLYLAASSSDGSSLSLLQAMHAGLPCLVSDLLGNREWLGTAGGGYAHDAASFAAGLHALAHLSPATRELIAIRNRTEVRAHADLAANLPRLLAALDEVARSAATPALIAS